jgi:acyl-CoA reductase-like NAD-dependent aldehyde dehydrogenase
MNSGAGTAVVESIDPANGELFETYEVFSESAIDEALGVASAAFDTWRKSSWSERSALMSGVAREFRADSEAIANTVSREMGKPITEALAEVEKCAWTCDYYAEHGEEYLRPESIDLGDERRVSIQKRPLGTVLAIMPWNYPLWQAIRAAAPIVSAGNCFALKHASNVTGCALWLEKVFAQAGAAKGVFTTLIIPGRKTSELISDPRIHAVTLTGSDAAGVAVGEAAGRAIKPVVLELGGSDPFIVLADADIDKAVEVAVKARFQNTGQSCIAAKRFIVVEAAADAFEEAFAAGAGALQRGAPLDPETQLGPMAREDLRDELAGIVDASVKAGGRVLTGASAPDEKGAWYEPTVLAGLPDDAPAFREETFGPVAAVARVVDEAAAVAFANQSEFGLGCSLWTTDLDRATALSAEIESGMVFVNAMTASDPRMPFGGVKRSGVGRELGGEIGMRAFLNLQTLAITP